MRNLLLFTYLILSSFASSLFAEKIIPTQVTSSYVEKREAAFTPWHTPAESQVTFEQLSRTNIPIYNEIRDLGENRDIYIPNTIGIPYWVLGGLSEVALKKVHHEKLKIGDELVSSFCYRGKNGEKIYWALWCPQNRAQWVKDRMLEHGLTPARVELEFSDHVTKFAADLNPYSGLLSAASLALSLLILVLVLSKKCLG